MGEDRRRIFDMLVKEAQTVGVSSVRDAANQFIRLGLRAIAEPTERKSVPRGWTLDLWRKQKGICARCHRPMSFAESTFDHIKPLAEGGLHSKKNGRAVHKECNSSKGANNIVEESKDTGMMINEILPMEEMNEQSN